MIADFPGKDNNPEQAIIRVGKSRAFINKHIRAGFDKRAFGDSFFPTDTPLERLFAHVLDGDAWTPGAFAGASRKNVTWVSSQAAVLDLDDNTSLADALAVPFIAEYAALVHPSASSCRYSRKKHFTRFDETLKKDVPNRLIAVRPRRDRVHGLIHPNRLSSRAQYRTRVVFIFDELVTGNFERWKALLIGIMAHVGLPIDEASLKPAQLYYGSTNRIEAPYINYAARLPIATAGALTVEQAESDMLREFARRAAPPKHRADVGDNRAAAYARAAFDRSLAELSNAAAGNKNNTLYKIAARLYSYAKAGNWPGITLSSVDAALESIVRGWPKYSKSKNTIDRAKADATPKDLELDETPPSASERKKKAQKRTLAEQVKAVEPTLFTADLTVDMPYISDIELTEFAGYEAVNIKSAMGTGKTELIPRILAHQARRLKREPTALYVTHRAALVESTAKRLKFMAYSEFDAELGVSITSAPHLSVTVDSLHRVENNVYDVVILDEITKQHAHLEGDTMRGGEHRRAYRALKNLVRSAGRVYGMDAQNSDTATLWLGKLRNDLVMSVENTHQPRGGQTMHMLADKTLAYDRAAALMGEKSGVVYITMSSKNETEVMAAYLAQLYPDAKGRLINSDNSHSKDAQAFLQNINSELPTLDYFITSPSLSTGVDITAPVRAVIGIFGNRPLSADDMMQSMTRCRNAQQRLAFVQPTEGNAETNAAEMIRRAEDNAVTTAQLANFAQHGVEALDGDLRGVNRLSGLYRAERNRQLNSPLSHYVALARSEGYTVEYQDGDKPAIRTTLKAIRETIRAAWDNDVLNNPAVSHDEYEQHRRAGTVTRAIRAGHERFIVEDVVGLTISPDLLDRLRTSEKRARIRRRADLLDDLENVKESDRHEAAEGKLLSKRGHKTAERLFVEDVVKRDFECGVEDLQSVIQDMPAHELHRRAGDLAALYRPQLVNLLGWRPEAHSSNPIPLLRWILSRVGIRLTGRQIMRDGERFMSYSIDLTEWQEVERLARAALVHRQTKRAAAEQHAFTKNLHIQVNQVFSNAAQPTAEPIERPYFDEFFRPKTRVYA